MRLGAVSPVGYAQLNVRVRLGEGGVHHAVERQRGHRFRYHGEPEPAGDQGYQGGRLTNLVVATWRLNAAGERRPYEVAGQRPIRVKLACIRAGQRVKPCHDQGFAPEGVIVTRL